MTCDSITTIDNREYRCRLRKNHKGMCQSISTISWYK